MAREGLYNVLNISLREVKVFSLWGLRVLHVTRNLNVFTRKTRNLPMTKKKKHTKTKTQKQKQKQNQKQNQNQN